MSLENLISRLESKEGLEIEFKTASGGLPSNLWETASAFANTNGGWILLGVVEVKSNLVVQGLKNAESMKQDIWNAMRNPQKISGEVCGFEDIRIEKLDDKSIIVMRVHATSSRQKPVFINGNPYKGTYIRRNEGDYRCSKQEVDRMIRDASAESVDSTILKGYDWEDIEKSTFDQYRQRYRQSNPASPKIAYDDTRFLKAIGGYRIDRESRREGFTRAAILMFGTQEALSNLRPRHLIDFRLLSEESGDSENRWAHRIAWEGNLYEAFFQIYPRLIDPLKTPFKLEGPYRLTETEAHEALRESLINMLAHADYSEQAALLVKASPKEFVFRNPGSSRISEEDLLTGDRSDPRNPVLLRMFRHVALAEEAGTGFPKILQIWRKAGLKLPSVISNTERYEFELTLGLAHLLSDLDRSWLSRCVQIDPKTGQSNFLGAGQLSSDEQLVLIHARNQGFVNNAAVQALTGLHRADITSLLIGLRNKGFLVQESTRRWASYKLSDAIKSIDYGKPIKKTYRKSPVDKPLSTKFDIADKPLSSKSNMVDKQPLRELKDIAYKLGRRSSPTEVRNVIEQLCRMRPLRPSELAEILGRHRRYVLTNYLRPMIQRGELEYLYPEKPRHPRQAYRAKRKS